MRRQPVLVAIATSVLVLAGCGTPGSSGGGAGVTTAAAPTSSGGAAPATCAPIAGNQLVVLQDDKHLQTVDNVIPAVNAAAASKSPHLLDVLNAVSATLDTSKLIALNKAVDVDRQTSSQAAAQFVTAQKLDTQQPVGAGAKVIVGAANFSESGLAMATRSPSAANGAALAASMNVNVLASWSPAPQSRRRIKRPRATPGAGWRRWRSDSARACPRANACR